MKRGLWESRDKFDINSTLVNYNSNQIHMSG
jgi:hypothetical protein